MKTDIFVSVVAPLKNDQAVVGPFIREVSAILRDNYTNYEIVLVDDRSEDQTVKEVSALLSQVDCVRLIRLSRPFGAEIAITAGLDSSIGDFVVVMVPESDPPALITDIVDRCREGSGVLTGVGRNSGMGGGFSEYLARAFHWYVRTVVGIDLLRGASHFQVFSRQAVNAITQIKDRYRKIRLYSAIIGYEVGVFDYVPISRTGRDMRPGFWQQFNDAVAIIVSNTLHPLRLVSRLGLVAGGLNLLYMGYVVLVYLFNAQVAPGWTTMSLQTSGMFFLLFLILTVLCEYIGRNLMESFDRPLYFVMDEKNSCVLLADPERRNVMLESK